MPTTADFDAGRLTRSLLRRSRQGALATLMAGSGDPYCSLVNVAGGSDGAPILLISGLARSAGGRSDHAGGPGGTGRRRSAGGALAPALPQRPSIGGSLCGF